MVKGLVVFLGFVFDFLEVIWRTLQLKAFHPFLLKSNSLNLRDPIISDLDQPEAY